MDFHLQSRWKNINWNLPETPIKMNRLYIFKNTDFQDIGQQAMQDSDH